MVAVIPRGFKDVLPGEARIRERLSEHVRTVLNLWGYAPIETPTLEVRSVLESASHVGNSTFQLFDADAQLLVLRPDVTLPVARLVASRLDTATAPFRFRYALPVFREQESLRGQAREFTQIGIESIGLEGPAADAEVITVFVESLRACGLEDFRVAFCSVEVLRALVEACGQDAAWNEAALAAFHTSDIVALDELTASAKVDPARGALLSELARINGGREALGAVRALLDQVGCAQVVTGMERTWELLEVAGVADAAVVDFSVVSSFDYYTGFVMEAYALGYGKPLGSGGRYDNLLASFGDNAPAAGFAFALERVMAALDEQGTLSMSSEDIVEVDGADEAAAFARVCALHRQGICALLATGIEGRR
jgi:ATP phosphoribosyltransferase